MDKDHNIIVDASGNGNVPTIQQALDLAPQDDSPYTIFIKPGNYREKLRVTRSNTHFIGSGKSKTQISYTSANGLLAKDGKIWATYNSYVVNADAKHVTFQDLTIENSFDFLANQRKLDSDTSKITATQAVALLVGENGDQIECKNCTLKSFQDTLYVSAGRSYFESVDIWGTVDFIFGGGTALFNQCQLVCRWRDDVEDNSPWGYVSAPSTLLDQEFGLVFYQCDIQQENIQVPQGSYKLGRPWHPTTQFDDGSYANPFAVGHCAYIECICEKHINGWDKMHGKDKNGQPIWFYAEDSRFFIDQSKHSDRSQSSPSEFDMTLEQKESYTLMRIFNGWQPGLLTVFIDKTQHNL